jgi:sugar phosphate isomerase/epimerase
LFEAVSKVHRSGMIVTSDVNSADDPDVERVLAVASRLGIRYFRMAYFKYDFSKKILPQLEAFAAQARKLAEVCKQLKMTALYQNHAGANYVGAPIWDLMEVLKGIDPASISIALDLRHTTIEASESWRAGYSRVRDSVGAVFAKDAIYADGKIDDGPLGRSEKGKQLFKLIQADHPSIPISLHMEYIDHRKPELLTQRLDAITADVKTLKSWL